ncbi:MAG: hypothetical protein EZS28_026520, partial [Streblomastix strix]
MNQNNSVEQQQCNSFNRIVTNQMNQQEQIDHVQLQGHLVSVENEDPNKIESDQERRQQFEGEQESIIIEQHYPDVARTDKYVYFVSPDPMFNDIQIVINTPKALHSLISLSGYKINIHFSQENDQQTLSVRHNSRWCLLYIHCSGDASAQTELVNTRYARVLVIAISTASGSGEEQDQEIWSGLFRLSNFLKCLHQGKQNSFPPQPLLVRRSVEQIEEEGGNEEIDSQIINKGKFFGYNIKDDANEAKGIILNYFIEQGNTKKRSHPIDSTAWEMEQGITSQSIHFTQSINKGEVV